MCLAWTLSLRLLYLLSPAADHDEIGNAGWEVIIPPRSGLVRVRLNRQREYGVEKI